MASLLKQLTDDDREALNHKLRRDAEADAAIWKWCEGRLTAKHAKGPLKKETAGAMIIKRYRDSREYKRWLDRFENQNAELAKTLAAQRLRYECLKELVQEPGESGIERISKSLQARLLTLAAERTDEELIEGSGKNGWIKNVIRVIQEQAKADARTTGEKAVAVAADEKLAPEERERRMKEIFGIA